MTENLILTQIIEDGPRSRSYGERRRERERKEERGERRKERERKRERNGFRFFRKNLQMLRAVETKNRLRLFCTSLGDEDQVETEQLFEDAIIEDYRIRWDSKY